MSVTEGRIQSWSSVIEEKNTELEEAAIPIIAYNFLYYGSNVVLNGRFNTMFTRELLKLYNSTTSENEESLNVAMDNFQDLLNKCDELGIKHHINEQFIKEILTKPPKSKFRPIENSLEKRVAFLENEISHLTKDA